MFGFSSSSSSSPTWMMTSVILIFVLTLGFFIGRVSVNMSNSSFVINVLSKLYSLEVSSISTSFDSSKKSSSSSIEKGKRRRENVIKDLSGVVPKHVAVIMDGNRRYGRMRFGVGQEIRGHRAGGELLYDFIGWCQDYGVNVLTVYAFSTENWKRPKREVDALMNVFVEQCPRIKSGCLERGVRIRVIASDFELLEPRIQNMFRELEEATKDLSTFHLNLCVSYGGRSEITRAARLAAQDLSQGKIKKITESELGKHMLTNGFPDPDIVIRTSGEHRLSNFLLWQLAYSEMVFVKKHWPELTENDFVETLKTFAGRKRRFGK